MTARYVVMGVSGSGKSSVGAGFAAAIGARFIDGDDLHPDTNVARMARGEPLDDDDRRPWLARIAEALRGSEEPVVIACSALRRRYRDWIRDGVGAPVRFLHLAGPRAVIAARMQTRQGHFMPPALLDSQFATLEQPDADEDALTVDIDQPLERVVGDLVAMTQPAGR